MISEETSDAIKKCLVYDRERLIKKRDALLQTIERANRIIHGGETARVAKSFHLGTVGGSGRAVRSLNRKRAREMDRTIDAANRWGNLHRKLGFVERKIAYIDAGSAYKDGLARAVKRMKRESCKPRPQDDFRAIENNMSAFGEHTLSDGARMASYYLWDETIRELRGIVALVDPAGLIHIQCCRASGRSFGETGAEIAKGYLNAPQDIRYGR